MSNHLHILYSTIALSEDVIKNLIRPNGVIPEVLTHVILHHKLPYAIGVPDSLLTPNFLITSVADITDETFVYQINSVVDAVTSDVDSIQITEAKFITLRRNYPYIDHVRKSFVKESYPEHMYFSFLAKFIIFAMEKEYQIKHSPTVFNQYMMIFNVLGESFVTDDPYDEHINVERRHQHCIEFTALFITVLHKVFDASIDPVREFLCNTDLEKRIATVEAYCRRVGILNTVLYTDMVWLGSFPSVICASIIFNPKGEYYHVRRLLTAIIQDCCKMVNDFTLMMRTTSNESKAIIGDGIAHFYSDFVGCWVNNPNASNIYSRPAWLYRNFVKATSKLAQDSISVIITDILKETKQDIAPIFTISFIRGIEFLHKPLTRLFNSILAPKKFVSLSSEFDREVTKAIYKYITSGGAYGCSIVPELIAAANYSDSRRITKLFNFIVQVYDLHTGRYNSWLKTNILIRKAVKKCCANISFSIRISNNDIDSDLVPDLAKNLKPLLEANPLMCDSQFYYEDYEHGILKQRLDIINPSTNLHLYLLYTLGYNVIRLLQLHSAIDLAQALSIPIELVHLLSIIPKQGIDQYGADDNLVLILPGTFSNIVNNLQ